MYLFIKIFQDFIEVKTMGLNIISLSFLATVILSAFQVRATIKQYKKIRNDHSSKTWNLTMFAYLCFYFLSFIVYGLHRNSLALMLSGFPGFFYLPIMYELHRRAKLSKLDIICSLALFSIIPFIMLSGHKGLLLLLMFGIGASSMFIQAYQMIKRDDFHELEPEFLLSFLASSLFWLIYSIAIGDNTIQLSSGLSLVFLSILLILYYRWYKKRSI